MTGFFAHGNDADKLFLEEHLTGIQACGKTMLFVNLTCEVEQLKARFNNPERRAQLGRVWDERRLSDFLKSELFKPNSVNPMLGVLLMAKNLDTTKLSIEQSADEIIW